MALYPAALMYLLLVYVVLLRFAPEVHAQGALSCGRGMYCPTDISNITNNGQVAYYSFWPENRLADETGISGSAVSSVSSPQFGVNGAWQDSHFFSQNSATFTIPNANNVLIKMFETGVSICFWYMSLDAWHDIYYFGFTGNSVRLYYQGIYGVKFIVNTYSGWPSIDIGGTSPGQWWHLCSTIYRYQTIHYWNSGPPQVLDTSSSFSYPANGAAYFSGTVDEFRLFYRVLSPAEVVSIRNFRTYPCPIGTANDLVNQRVCQPCAPNTFQSLPGQAVCAPCQHAQNTYFGGKSCTSASVVTVGPEAWQGVSNTPGTATYTVGANSISFNCPSGTFSPTVQSVVRMTSACSISNPGAACTAGTCCIWMSSSAWTNYNTIQLFDGLLSTEGLTETSTYQFFAVDFLTSQYVDGILIFDAAGYAAAWRNPDRTDNLRVYIGNTLISATTSTPCWGCPPQSYPTNNNANQLCYSGSNVDTRYRHPMYISCRASGRYLYIVNWNSWSTHLHASEVVILSQPPCTLCPAGKYSHYSTPNTECTDCPVGTFSNTSGASACMTCPTGTFQPLSGQSWCRANIPAGSYSQFGDLLAYYPFFNGSSVDVTGRSSNMEVSQQTATIVPFQSSTTVRAFQAQASLGWSYVVRGVPVGQLITRPGLTICGWASISAHDGGNNLWGLHVPGKFFTGVRQLSTASNTLILVNEGYGDYSPIYTFTLNTWFHMCMAVIDGIAYEFHVDGVYAKLKFLGYGNTVDAWEILFGAMTGQLADIKIFSKYLNGPEAMWVTSKPFSIPCPPGSFQNLPNQDTCIPCDIGRFSTAVGATSCTTACAGCTWYGSSANTWPYVAGTGGFQYTPGRVNYRVNTNTISFNCPSGTYSPTVFEARPLRTTCASCDSQCCMWMSSVAVGTTVANLMDGTTSLTHPVWYNSNSWFAFDFRSSIYIDSVAILSPTTSWGNTFNNMLIFVGDTYYANPQYGQFTPPNDTRYDYPVSTQNNQLCYAQGTEKSGYMYPLVVRCQAWGRYLYIVQPGAVSQAAEIMITNTSICTPCSPGTYSYNTIPNARCSQCPAGTYQSGAGKSYCDACHTGTFQTGVGMTSADNCVGLSSGLIAHYAFAPGARLTDSTGISGSLTFPNTVTPAYSSNGPWPGAPAAVFTGSNFFNLPSMNIAAPAATSGLSVCLWFSFASTIAWTRVFAFGDAMDTGTRLTIGRVGSATTLAFYFQSTAGGTSVNFPRPIVLNRWRHVCITTASLVWRVYDDAELVITVTASANLNNVVYTLNWLAQNHRYDPIFVGSIDDFRIYNRSLSAVEVRSLFNFRSYQYNSTAFCRAGTFCPTRTDVISDNLLAYYSFWNDNPLLDATGVTGNAVAFNSPGFETQGPWTEGHSMGCNGAATLTHLQLPAMNLYQYSATTGFSICVWFWMNWVYNNERVFDFGRGFPLDNIYLSRDGTSNRLTLTFMQGATGSTMTFPREISNAWRHVCVVNRGRSWTLYDNSEPVVFATAAFDLNNVVLNQAYVCRSNFAADQTMGGRIDELRIYNVALTYDQVQDIFAFRNWRCPAGSFCPDGVQAPVACPRGQFQASTGSTACSQCPVNTYTLSQGATTSAQCVSC